MTLPDRSGLSLSEQMWQVIILTLSAILIIITVWCLSHGITTIFMHLYYFPIVLLAYHYRWKGCGLATLLALAYLGLVILFETGQPDVIMGALYRFLVFVGIAAIIAYLSERLVVKTKMAQESTEIRERYISLAPAIIIALDRDGVITYINHRGCEMLGCSQEDVIGTSWFDRFLPPKDRDRVKREFSRLVAGPPGPDSVFENPVVTGSGTEKVIRWHNTLLHDETGAITGTLGFGEDITEEKWAQKALREMQQFQENVITNANVWISVLAPDGTILVWNEAAEAISGYRKDTVLGKNTVWKQMYPDAGYRKKVTGAIQRIIGQDSILENFETEIHCADTTTKTIVWNTRGLKDKTGKVTSFIAIGRDVSAQKSAEIRAGESSRFLASMIDTLPMPIFFKDTRGVYLGCNPPFEEYIGIKRGDLMGKSVYDISPQDLADKYAAADQQLFDNPVPQRYETQVQYADGSRHDVIFHKAPFFNKDGSLGGLIGTFLDITERKRIEDALAQSEGKYRTLFENMIEGFAYCRMIYDEKGRSVDWIYLSVNHSFERLTGQKNVEGKRVLETIPDIRELTPEIFDMYGRVASTGTPETFEIDFKPLKTWLKISAFCPEKGYFVAVFEDITERKVSQDRIRQLLHVQEEQLRIINTSPAVAFLWKAEEHWPVESVSENISQFGYSPDDFISGRVLFSSIIHTDDIDRVGTEVEYNSSHNIDDYIQEYRVFSKNHDLFWVADYTHIRRDKSGTITHYEGIVLDITDRKKIETELQNSQHLLSEAMDMAQMADWEMDGPTGVFTFNDRFYALYGTTAVREGGYQMPAEVYAREFTHPDDRHLVEEEIAKALSTSDSGYHSLREHRIIRRDGEIRWIIVRIRVTKDAEGRTIKTHGANQDVTDMKRAEDALRESEGKYRLLTENTLDIIYSLDLAGKITHISPHIARYGFTPEQLLFKDASTIIYEEDLGKVMADIQINLSSERSTQTIFRFKDAEGKLVWFEDNSAALKDATGTVVGISGVLRDITERKNYDEALRNSRQLFMDIISFLPDPTFVIDKEATVIAWNRALEQLSGVAQGDILGKGDYEYSLWCYGKRRPVLIDLVLNPDKDAARLNYTDFRSEGHIVTAQTIITHASSGRKIPLLAVTSPLLDANGKITGAIESMRDISRLKEAEADLARINQNLEQMVKDRTRALQEEVSQRREAEKEVQASLDYTRSVIEANPDLMVLLDSNGIILDVNTAGEILTGIKQDQLIGTTYFGYLVEDGTVQSAFAGLLEKGRIENLVRIQRIDGHITPLSVHATVIRGREGNNDRIIVAAHDITRQKEDEAVIRAALDEQVLLLREVHHRVKNNLQIIISLTNLQMRQTDDPRVRQILSETQNRVKAMSLVHEKLYRSQSLSRIDFADYSRFLATQLFSFFGMDTRRVKLEFAMTKTMVDIVTAVPLGLLMNELVSNALKHAFPQGREGVIGISCGSEGDTIRLIVRDNGIGMPKDLDWKNTSSLGMRLVTSLVDQVDGTITIDRENGTTFEITAKRPAEVKKSSGMQLSGRE